MPHTVPHTHDDVDAQLMVRGRLQTFDALTSHDDPVHNRYERIIRPFSFSVANVAMVANRIRTPADGRGVAAAAIASAIAHR